MKALPAALRPNPYNAEEYILLALEKGWDIDRLARATYVNERNPNPAFVITNLRTLCMYPPQQTEPKRKTAGGHIACTEPGHEHGCIICTCVPNETQHFVPKPMPQELFADYQHLLRKQP
jgi:hypothetical protein